MMSSLQGRTILLTGAGGFIGRRLKERLQKAGADVHCLIRAGTQAFSARDHLLSGEGAAAVSNLQKICEDTKPDIVIHLASLFLASHTPADIDSLIDSNIRLGTRLLEAMEKAGIRRIINTGTFWQHFENRTYDPVNLYAATKQAFEDILTYYVNSNAFQAITLQLYDTYGPGDTRPKVLALLNKIARENSHLGMSPGEQFLDLVHVDDVCAAFETAAVRMLKDQVQGHEVYAVSSSNPVQLREIVNIFNHAAGSKLDIGWGERPYRAREVMHPYNKGIPVPGWEPRISLHEGIRDFIHSNQESKT